MKRHAILLILILTVLATASCDSDRQLYKERVARAARPHSSMVLGIVDTSTERSLFVMGVNLAVSEANAAGGVRGKNVSTLYYDDGGSVPRGQSAARSLVDNINVVAVVGHFYSKVAIPASIIYEETGTLFMAPSATQPELTQHDTQFVFRNVPTDDSLGQMMAEYAHKKGYHDVAVIYERGSYGERVYDAFAKGAELMGMGIPVRRSYFTWETDYRPIIYELQRFRFDAVFLAGLLPEAAKMLRQLRHMGMNLPVMGTDALDSSELFCVAGDTAEGLVIPSFFNPSNPSEATRKFVDKFQAAFGMPPDTMAAQGYDAVQAIVQAANACNSTIPLDIASCLRFMVKFDGAAGSYTFTPSGDITGRTLSLKTVKNGKFKFLDESVTTDSESTYPPPAPAPPPSS